VFELRKFLLIKLNLRRFFSIGLMMLPLLAVEPTVAPFSEPPIGTQKPILYEDFEATPVGEIPKGFTNVGSLSVVEENAHSGKKCLKVATTPKGARMIKLQGDILKTLGGSFWGRLYFKVQLPSPLPDGKSIHTTLVAAPCISPLSNDNIELRLFGTSMNSTGSFSYLYNVQTRKRGEFGKSTKATNVYSGEWTCAEWYVDYETQTYRSFVNGVELPELKIEKGAGNYTGIEIPQVFDSLSFGWQNYQPATDGGFTVWIDDIALGKDRIGTR
jgi:hypothetical protein